MPDAQVLDPSRIRHELAPLRKREARTTTFRAHDHACVVPGPGDAGDRIFGTK